ncbi:MAG: MBL fold metallo-hydrolase, partial [Gammaproteobacteria bacterium]|nr:MBL fold metallo-hydrolase [Gammaproteobacteria bacterium]
AAAPWPALAAAVAGALVLVLPRGIPGRPVAAACLLPLLAWPVPRPPPGSLWLTLLDVGQGLAVVVRTRHHTLVYDAGPRYGATLDAGGAVVAPFLRHAGRHRVDTLVLSHAQADHVGGAATLLETIAVERVIGDAPGLPAASVPCVAGQSWRWDGVAFHLLHPLRDSAHTGNDASCVVLVVAADGSRVLLPGDIEVAAERELVARAAARLAAGVLVVPHHGSRTSSSDPFLDAVQARLALLAVGYRNRHEHPDGGVVRRLRARGIAVYDTASAGAIEVRADARGVMRIHRLERVAARGIWRAASAQQRARLGRGTGH